MDNSNTWVYIGIIVWLLCGVIAIWRGYHSYLKLWYENFQESYWDFNKIKGKSTIKTFLTMSPILILGGLASLITIEIFIESNYKCWWFTTKNKPKRSNN